MTTTKVTDAMAEAGARTWHDRSVMSEANGWRGVPESVRPVYIDRMRAALEAALMAAPQEQDTFEALTKAYRAYATDGMTSPVSWEDQDEPTREHYRRVVRRMLGQPLPPPPAPEGER